MSLVQRIVSGAKQLRADVSGTPAPWDDFWYSPLGVGSSTGMRITAETAKRIAAVLACVSIISKNVAMMPLKVYSDQPDGGKKVASAHPLFDVLYSTPNAQQTAFEFRQMLQGHLELRGNAYAEIRPGRRGAVDQLIPMHPDRVTPEQMRDGHIRYRYQDPLSNTTRYLAQEEVFHLRNFSDDGLTGQSTVVLGADTFGVALAAQEYWARFFENDARPTMAITGASFKSKEDEQKFKDDIQSGQTGKNRHKTMVLSGGMDLKAIGLTANDAALLDSRKFSRIEICSIFGVPPHLIGETEKTATYASVEQFNIMFAVQCILPRLVLWEQAIQRDLILSPKYFAKFSMSALLRGDTASRFAAYQIAINNGWMSQNDVRIAEDLNPIPDGDTYWRPLNWAPLRQVENPPEPGTTTADPSAGDAPAQNRLRLLAMSAAERCVRKEVSAVRKIVDKGGEPGEIAAFYAEHRGFVADVLRISSAAAAEYCARHQEKLCATPNLEERRQLVNLIEQGGAFSLAAKAVGGVQ